MISKDKHWTEYFVCFVVDHSDEQNAVHSAEQGCHHRTEMFGDACYYLSDFPTTYSRAKSFCEDTGTNLVDMSDMKEYAYIWMMLSAKHKFVQLPAYIQ